METVKEVFNERTYYKFSNKAVDENLLKDIYNKMKLGPTSGNSCPLRIVFIKSETEKEKLLECAAEMNRKKMQSAPVIALFAFDLKFFKKMDKLYPTGVELRNFFASSEEVAFYTAFRNSSLQAGYFLIIARSMGLDCGPMSGFDENKLNETFFKDTDFKINFICNLGYRDGDTPYPRLPRLDFDECCKII